jgi:hypothetical protein
MGLKCIAETVFLMGQLCSDEPVDLLAIIEGIGKTALTSLACLHGGGVNLSQLGDGRVAALSQASSVRDRMQGGP